MEELSKQLDANMEVIENRFANMDYYKVLEVTLRLMEVKAINNQTKAIESMKRVIKNKSNELSKEDY